MVVSFSPCSEDVERAHLGCCLMVFFGFCEILMNRSGFVSFVGFLKVR